MKIIILMLGFVAWAAIVQIITADTFFISVCLLGVMSSLKLLATTIEVKELPFKAGTVLQKQPDGGYLRLDILEVDVIDDGLRVLVE